MHSKKAIWTALILLGITVFGIIGLFHLRSSPYETAVYASRISGEEWGQAVFCCRKTGEREIVPLSDCIPAG